MPVTKVGIVYYKDDPDHKAFRIVYPEFDDSELDEPPTDCYRRVIYDERGQPHSWHTLGVDLEREAVLEKVSVGSPRVVLTGSV